MAKWMRVDEVCAYTKIRSRKTVYRDVRAGKLRVAKIGAGRNWVTCEQWVDEWLTRASDQSPQERQQ